MVALFKSLELTAAPIIRIFIQTHNLEDDRWNLEAGTKKRKYTTQIGHAKPTYSLHCPMMHCVYLILVWEPSDAFSTFQERNVIET